MSIELTGRIDDLAIDYKSGMPKVTITLDSRNGIEQIEELKAKEKLTIKVSKYCKKRSLDSNAYFWVLLSKLAEKMQEPKTEIYKRYIKEIGGNNNVVCVKSEATDLLMQGWQHNGLGWVAESYPSKLDGCSNVILYYGSSTYNTEQMSRLINLVVQDCEAVGIQTLTPQEIENLLRAWGQKNEG